MQFRKNAENERERELERARVQARGLVEQVNAQAEQLLDALEDDDDVQNVWHNWDAPETDDEE